MIRRIALFAAAFLAASLLVAGCQSTAPPAPKPEPVSAAAYPHITATGNLNTFLAYDKPRVIRSDDGPMSVTVPVRVLRKRSVPAQYRFLFFDDRGQPLHPTMDWQYKVLPGRVQAFLEGTALNAAAADWRLEIRPSR